MPPPAIRLGTRGSPLARAQAASVAAALSAAGAAVKIAVVKTGGDRWADLPLAASGGDGLFVKELEEALQRREIDLAVHSLKDLPARFSSGLALAGSPRREDPRDALVLPRGRRGGLEALPRGAKIGSGSVRRQGYLRALRPDLQFVPLRGNVDTRLCKLDAGEVEALVLACAGLNRLGYRERISFPFPEDDFVPQAGQGALGLELREEERALRAFVEGLADPNTSAAVCAERAFLAAMGMGCAAPLGCFGRVAAGHLVLRARLCDPQRGLDCLKVEEGPAAEAAAIGERLARAFQTVLGGRR